MKPLISVIVPVYKVEQYIERCIESILRQTYKNIEIILVDDGSPDACGVMCDKYAAKDSRIRVIHKENGGLSSARNAGMQTAKGEYICFVDSDDWLDETFVEVLEALLTEKQTDFSACRFCEVIEGNPVPQNKASKAPQLFEENLMRNAIIDDTYAGFACNKLFRADIIHENGLRFDEKIFNGEDLPFTIEYLKHCRKGAYVPSELYFYNIRPQSITTSRQFSERAYTILYAREKVLAMLEKYAPDCVDIEMAAYLSHLIKMKYVLEPIKVEQAEKYAEVSRKLKENQKGILSLQGVSAKSKCKLFAMVHFSGIFGKIYRGNKL